MLLGIELNFILFKFYFLILAESAHGVRFNIDRIKYVTISSTVAKRRPAPQITVASGPQQVLSPKRLRPTSLTSSIPNLNNSLNLINNNNNLNISNNNNIIETDINNTLITSTPQTTISSLSTNPTLLTTTLTSGGGLVGITAAVAQHQHQQSNIMDNSIGQMTPMAPLALSQSMDSVNTASNEEEVSSLCFLSRCTF